MSTSFFRVKEHIVPCQHIRHYYQSTSVDQEAVLHLAVKQYIPLDNPNPRPGDVTFLGAHANGVGKELYEPLWDEIYKKAKVTGKFRIRAIWIADVSFQGQSSVLNENKLGIDHSWMDHPRDLLHLINVYRSEFTRPIVGLGHSMGGNNIVNLALMHPRLLSQVVLIDPVIQRFATAGGNYQPAYMSTLRRDIWPSREEAARLMLRNKFYQSWDPRVFERWIKYGLRDLPTPLYPSYPKDKNNPDAPPPPKPVTLTTTKHDEVATFLRSSHPPDTKTKLEDYEPPHRTHPDIPRNAAPGKPFYRPEPLHTLSRMPSLRPRCFYVFASDSYLSASELRADKLAHTGMGFDGNGGVDAGAVKNVVIKDAGHFVPFEQPVVVAENVVSWLSDEMEYWREEEKLNRTEQEAVSKEDRRKLPDAKVQWIRHTFGPESSKKQDPSKSGTQKL